MTAHPTPMNLLYDDTSYDLYPPKGGDYFGLEGQAIVERDKDGTPRRIVWEREK